jgi:MerR family transcriptional regulator, mercuric resistance operon regulatory protein
MESGIDDPVERGGARAYALRTMVRSQALTIAKLAAAGDVGVETVRYYQRRGLLAVPEREASGAVRRYGDADVRRLRFIRHAQAAGFTLAQIGELIDLDAMEDRAQAGALASARADEIDRTIAALQASRDALRRLARECGEGHAGPCPILSAFER